MSDIARKAGVSRVTVSYVLNNSPTSVKISKATTDKVRRIASDLGYFPNEIARSMVNGKTRVIAFWGLDHEHEYHAKILNACLKSAQARNYSIKLMDENLDATGITQFCVGNRIAGVIAKRAKHQLQMNIVKTLAKHDIPIIFVNSHLPDVNVSEVNSDDFTGVRDAVCHLVELGHRQIIFIGGHKKLGYVTERENGFKAGLDKKGIKWNAKNLINLKETPTCYEQVEKISEHLLRNQDISTTAVVCVNDLFAAQLTRKAFMMGINVPNQLSIIGFGDMTISRYTLPPLTTIAQPFDLMGQKAVELLLNQIEHMESPYNSADPLKIQLPVKIVHRDSTATNKQEISK